MFSVSAPEELTNIHIQNIGIRYIELYGKKSGFFHENHPIAYLLKNYSDNSSVEEKWIFLANIYPKLNSAFYSCIGHKIISLFSKAFHRPYDIYIEKLQPSIHLAEFIAGILSDKVKAYFLEKKVNNLNDTIRNFTIN
jgi:hypothetical protein